MSDSFNPFKPGTRNYKIAERVNKGDSNDKIVKELKLKSKLPIYAVNSKLKSILKQRMENVEQKKEKQPRLITKIEYPGHDIEKYLPREPSISTPRNSKGDDLMETRHIPFPPRTSDEGRARFQVKDYVFKTLVKLKPSNIMLIQKFMSKYKWEGDLNDFINEAIDDFFRSRNWRIKIEEREGLP